jgi:hypothetical protein
MNFLKKAWKFITGFAIGIAAFIVGWRLYRHAKKEYFDPVATLPHNDGLRADIRDNRGRAGDVRDNHRAAEESAGRASATVDRLEAGNRELKDAIEESEEVLRRVRNRRRTDTGSPTGGSGEPPKTDE